MIPDWIPFPESPGWTLLPGSFLPKVDVDTIKDDFTGFLSEDMGMLTKGRYALSVSWLPEGDPKGCYHCCVAVDQDWEHTQMKFDTRDYKEVLAWIKTTTGVIDGMEVA